MYQLGKAIPFLVDTLSYVISVISLSLIKTNFQEERTIEKVNIKKDLSEGISWLFRNKVIRDMAIINAGEWVRSRISRGKTMRDADEPNAEIACPDQSNK